MVRRRTPGAVRLDSHPLDDHETGAFLDELGAQLATLSTELATGQCERIGQVPLEIEVVPRVVQWLDAYGAALVIAQSPRTG
jgi:hypothetical protein